jgi:hypothetical protein
MVKIHSAAAIGWAAAAAVVVLGAAFVGTWRLVRRLERKAYDDVIVNAVEIGCEGDEIRQVGVEAFLWHTDPGACFPTLTRAEVDLIGDAVFVTVFKRCRNGSDPPMVKDRGVLPRYAFILPVRWKRRGPLMYANEYAPGRVTKPMPVKVTRSCRAPPARVIVGVRD